MNPIAQNNENPRPIQDVAPPDDSLGNLTQFANIPVQKSPGSEQATWPAPAQAHPAEQVAEETSKDLKNVDKEAPKIPQKTPGLSNPSLVIAAAVIAGAALIAAAIYAFRSSS